MRLFLVRHGETEWNRERRIQGQVDVPLNERGRLQADGLAARLAREPLAAVYSSDLSRALETAQAIALPHGLPVAPEPSLRELRFGAWEGLHEEEIQAGYPEEYRAWRSDSVRHRPPGGETILELYARVTAVYHRIREKHLGQSVVVVAHGGPIRALVLHVLGAPILSYPRLRLHTASLTLIEVEKCRPVLTLFNCTDPRER